MDDVVAYPGAQRPARQHVVDSAGVGIAVSEWGDADAPPLLLAHGGFDFAGTYDVFAPLLADGGWRIVSWDFRGHGDSQHAALYSWQADLRDALTVLDSLGEAGPIPFVGHSKGAGILLDLAEAVPHRVSHVVNIDGLPSYRNQPDRSDHERTRMLSTELAAWLDHRRASASKARRAGTLDELAERRRRMNPRLSIEWLRYLVTVGGRKDDDGWRWKIDPGLRMGGFGPWRPEWSLIRLPGIRVPFLGVLAGQPEVMGWGTQLEDIAPWLPDGAEIESFDDAGHFVHIEQPQPVADLVLDFLERHR
jgi:pimeloyl-ACP methyl ester carboxylesterase